MPTKQPEQDFVRPVLTLPEPVAPAHLNPYVVETLAAQHSEPVLVEAELVAPLSQVEPPAHEQVIPALSTAEEEVVPPEPVAILTESMANEIERIISAEPAPEAPAPWAELTVGAHQLSAERPPAPIETFTYFTQSLHTWHESPVGAPTTNEIATDEPDISTEQLLADLPETDRKAMIAISHEVAEHLQKLEPAQAEEVSSVISEINTTITKVQELSRPETAEDLVLLEEAKQELEALCEELFDALDIEHDEVSINYFVQIMLLKQFRSAMDIAAYKDRLGTHEFKHHFPPFGAIAQIIAGEIFHFMLGRLALLQTKSQEQSLAQSS